MKRVVVVDIEVPKGLKTMQKYYFLQLKELLPFVLTVEDEDDG